MTTSSIGPAAAAGKVADRTRARGDVIRDVRVARRAVFDAERRITSYDLMFLAPETGPELQEISEQATSQLIGSTFSTFGLESLADGRPVFINFTRPFLIGMLPVPVPPGDVIIEVPATVTADHELLLGLSRLRQDGYRVSVGGYRGDLGRTGMLELADFVRIDPDSVGPVMLPGLVSTCRYAGTTLVATGITDAEGLRRSTELGFDLFCGPFLQRPGTVSRRILTPSQLVGARLLADLGDPEVPIGRIERLVGSDPGLSMRLLRTANAVSAASEHVESLRQALVLIGPRRLRSWVMLTMLEGTATRNSADDLWNVLARARTCQRLVLREPDVAFTVGLLSGAADLLGATHAEIAEGSALGERAREALVDGQGEVGMALRAVLAHERDEPDGVTATGFMPADVSAHYLEGLRDALQLVHEVLGR